MSGEASTCPVCLRRHRGERCPGPLREKFWETVARLKSELAELRTVVYHVRDLAARSDIRHIVDFLEDEVPTLRGRCGLTGHVRGPDGHCTRCGTFML